MSAARRHMLASDNASGVHPRVLRRLSDVNAEGHALGYGADSQTERALSRFAEEFGEHSSTFMVLTGTSANVLALQGMVRPHEAVYCHSEAHLWRDECGAPERYLGCKLIPVAGEAGKLEPARLREAMAEEPGIVHRSQPRVISLAQPTERGTLYTLDELRELAAFARENGLLLHMDGARIANAAAAMGATFRQLTTEAGIDVVSFGGTKNGLMMAEAVVVLKPELAQPFAWIRKQGMQLASKHRFLAAQYLAYFDDELWQKNADQANRMAQQLALRLASYAEVTLCAPVEVNIVFARLPSAWVPPLQRVTPFLSRARGAWSEVRLVTSFDTEPADVDAFVWELDRLAR